MLPRSHRLRITQTHRCASGKCLQAIRYQTLGCPITPTDHVASTSRRNTGGMPCRAIETCTIASHNRLGGTLASTVGIMPTQCITFTVRIDPFSVVIHLVSCHDHHSLHALDRSYRLQQMDRSHDVRSESAHRICIAWPHQRLSGEMQYNRRLCRLKCSLQCGTIRYVGPRITCQLMGNASFCEQTRCRRRIQRISVNTGTHSRQPQGQPTSLEPRVAG